MSEAVGSYLKTLRQLRGSSQEGIARILNVSSKQVSNWERGVHVPAAQAMGLLFQTIGGSFQDIFELLSNDQATAQDGQDLAEQWQSSKEILACRLEKARLATGAYLTTFLDILNLDNDIIAKTLQLSVGELKKIRTGQSALSEALVVLLVSQLHVPLADLVFLWGSLAPTQEEGLRLAKMAISKTSHQHLRSSLAGLSTPSPTAPTAIGAFLRGLRDIERKHFEAEYPEEPEYDDEYDDGYDDYSSEEHELSDEELEESRQRTFLYIDLADQYISKVDRGEVGLTEIAFKLLSLKATEKEIEFLLANPDLKSTYGDRLALTRMGIGNVDAIINSVQAANG